MGLEVRRVTPDWQHPSDWRPAGGDSDLAYRPKDGGRWIPQHDEWWQTAFRRWWWERIKWFFVKWASLPFVLMGCFRKPPGPWATGSDFSDDWGDRPTYWGSLYRKERWKDSDRTHYQLYETVSEGTPVSPHFATVEELADWCATQTENGGRVWVGDEGMTRDDWGRFFERGGFALSGVFTPGEGYEAGVKYASRAGSDS